MFVCHTAIDGRILSFLKRQSTKVVVGCLAMSVTTDRTSNFRIFGNAARLELRADDVAHLQHVFAKDADALRELFSRHRILVE